MYLKSLKAPAPISLILPVIFNLLIFGLFLKSLTFSGVITLFAFCKIASNLICSSFSNWGLTFGTFFNIPSITTPATNWTEKIDIKGIDIILTNFNLLVSLSDSIADLFFLSFLLLVWSILAISLETSSELLLISSFLISLLAFI